MNRRCFTTFALAMPMIASGIAFKAPLMAKADATIVVSKETSFYFRGINGENNTTKYIDISTPYFDTTQADTGTFAGMYPGNPASIARYERLQFFGYVYVNGKPIIGTGDDVNEDGVSFGTFNVVNATDCKYSIRFRINVPEGFEFDTIEIKKGFQLPTWEYLEESMNPASTKTELPVLQSIADFTSIKTGNVAWEWTVTCNTNVDEVVYTQDFDENTNKGYVGFSLLGDDYEGEEEAVDPDTYWRYNYQDIYINDDPNIKPFKQGYSYYSLGEKGQGMDSLQCNVAADGINKITIPQGTTFPARITTDIRPLNSGNYPTIYYTTSEERSFVNIDGQFVCLEVLADEKVAALEELSGYANLDNYLDAQKALISECLADAAEEIENAVTIKELAAIVAKYEAIIDGIPDIDGIAAFEARKVEAKAEVANYKSDGDYAERQRRDRQTIVDEAAAQIDAAISHVLIDEAVANAKAKIDLLPTRAELPAIDAYRSNKKIEASTYKADVAYSATTKAQKNETLRQVLLDLDDTYVTAEMDILVENYKDFVDGLITQAEEEAVALAERKASAIDEINQFASSINPGEYSDQSMSSIAELIAAARNDVESAESIKEVDDVVANLKTNIGNIEKGQAEPVAPTEGGCGGAIIGSIAVAGVALVASIILLFIRKYKIHA